MAVTLVLGFSSCGSDDDDDNAIDTSPVTLYAGDKTVIDGASTVESENEFVAYVNKDLSIEGFHVGETYVKANGKSRVKVTVKGKYKTYDDPVTEWGCSQSVVRSRQTQGTLSSRSDDESLIYMNPGHASAVMYSFENGKLVSVGAVVSTAYTSEYAGYLSERYLMGETTYDGDTYFMGIDAMQLEDANTVVMMQVYSASQLVTVYMPASRANNSSAKADVVKRLRRIRF